MGNVRGARICDQEGSPPSVFADREGSVVTCIHDDLPGNRTAGRAEVDSGDSPNRPGTGHTCFRLRQWEIRSSCRR